MLLSKLQQQQKQLAFKKPNYTIFGSIHERGKPDSRTQKCFIKWLFVDQLGQEQESSSESHAK